MSEGFVALLNSAFCISALSHCFQSACDKCLLLKDRCFSFLEERGERNNQLSKGLACKILSFAKCWPEMHLEAEKLGLSHKRGRTGMQ